MPASPSAFMSYARFDDEHNQYFFTEFRAYLIDEVRELKGARSKFDIFQDSESVKWGRKWRECIEEALDAATFLIAIMTPSFFESPYCRHEVEVFLQREKDLEKNHLIMPLYYIEAAVLEIDALRVKDPVASKLHDHQRVDWRDLRFTSIKTKKARVRINSLAKSIVRELGSDPVPPQVPGSDGGHDEAESPQGGRSLVSNAERTPDSTKGTPARRRGARNKKLSGSGSGRGSSGLAAQLKQVTFQPAEPTILAIRAAKALRALAQPLPEHPAKAGEISYVAGELKRALRSAVSADAGSAEARSYYEKADSLRELLINLVAE